MNTREKQDSFSLIVFCVAIVLLLVIVAHLSVQMIECENNPCAYGQAMWVRGYGCFCVEKLR